MRGFSKILLFTGAFFLGPLPALGQSFDEGIMAYNRGNYAIAIESFRPLAEKGDVSAQYNLGVMYDKGQGVPQNYVEAVKWYRSAAEQGQADSQYSLAIMYYNGEGVPQDHSNAVFWFRRAAEQGHTSAQYNLQIMYYNGEGVPRNPVMAYLLSNLAAAQNHEDAIHNRDVLLQQLSSEQIAEGQRMASEWRVGTRLPFNNDFTTWP